MIAAVLRPVVRRAILDLVDDVGGELNDETIMLMLNELGHRVARSDTRDEIEWLANGELLRAEEAGPFIIVRSTSNGRDVASGLLRIDGVSRHKTGE